jgi:hypothetical protein
MGQHAAADAIMQESSPASRYTYTDDAANTSSFLDGMSTKGSYYKTHSKGREKYNLCQ